MKLKAIPYAQAFQIKVLDLLGREICLRYLRVVDVTSGVVVTAGAVATIGWICGIKTTDSHKSETVDFIDFHQQKMLYLKPSSTCLCVNSSTKECHLILTPEAVIKVCQQPYYTNRMSFYSDLTGFHQLPVCQQPHKRMSSNSECKDFN